MPATTEFDTIAAISTPPGEGAISIVRISGEDSLKVIGRIFRGNDLSKVPSHTINYGHIKDPKTNKNVDEVMVSVMRAPKTYTCEDIIEINCHGGIVATNKILSLVLANGARMAEPGEFTKRAFLNGRVDLTEAESVMDIIRSKTDRAMEVAEGQLGGNLHKLIKDLRQDILEALAQVEVNIDYPEYDEEQVTADMMRDKATSVKKEIQKLLKTAQQGKVLRNGLATAIVGRPNVGKSSILNHLLQEDKAIVTDVAGTTRDVLEEYVNVGGVPLKLVDTAGIHDTDDKVEKIGVERSRQAIHKADLILLVLDASQPLTAEDKELLTATENKHRLILFNKSDLPAALTISDLPDVAASDVIKVSGLTGAGMEDLAAKIEGLFNQGIENSQNDVMVTNARQIGLLESADQSLTDVLNGLDQEMPLDLVQIDMTECWNKLGEITGDAAPDELITQLFSQFCLGK
ncbi:trmE protein [Lactobacillus selangorensis]|uniref:tRNA modification GTPase MnmE n=1 Tax=Lactobacillus selangorensis TaxID=81857 RepID=A0A0R2FIW8_9LACO|nr:tRNA uridine-5-carboxymethylaminomethyl(34) synthesis GTPase MnmE [Lactobacillus selangorensis]KRN28610.1 trmE protein [Lactobacillus selangorensis]KRN32980.1 trmE protein [Lactobacillus selangorensis]